MRRLVALVTAAALGIAACTGGGAEESTEPAASTSVPTTPPTTSTVAPIEPSATTTTTQPPSPDGRVYPAVPDTPEAAADRLAVVEARIHTTDPTDPAWADLAHEQQMLYRVVARNPGWIPTVLDAMPEPHRDIAATHLAARRAIAGIDHGDPPVNVPAWEIIDPLPADELERLYREAEAATGIDWTFLAAINLLETGYGRIDGLSTAGAQGPMQFLPTTWEEVSDGDIDDPHDAIPAAARYLVRRGGPDDMHDALWGYNNSNSYVAAVTHYANLFRDDHRSFLATHAWEIHYSAAIGDLWFPVGYRREEPVPATEHVAEAPWSAPPPAPS